MALKPSVYLVIFRLPDENVQFEHIREIMDLLNIVIHRIEVTDHDDIEIVKGDIPTPQGHFAIPVELFTHEPINPALRQLCIEDAFLTAIR